ncbi:ligase-associated DNA damage response endonuclease PdeM [Caldilinea sp.]|uniref:ligase-associated DNA damage response endonuclease PdeM n=1 Tax=Caldilinea sp. TaxID=2293560 RepID=UPI002BA88723|nr:ligase-associated DNA damage response endonuclease PdeM [Caldilinea sp.]HRA65720.1 ligase-associated DNA damage response endonuclease PdeM [Caldilinea sp.]
MTDRAQAFSTHSTTIDIAGETLTLLAERALYWPRTATLFIADPHFGKTDSFQAAGIPIPGGATGDDLARLARVLAATGAVRLVILGDFFHTRASQSREVTAALENWRRDHQALEIVLVGGNHDRHAGPPPAALAIEQVAEPFALAPFACCHHPPALFDAQPEGYALAGHEHPAVVLRDVDSTHHRFPCFHVGARAMVLPAFGTFTGGHTVRPRKGDRLFIVSDAFVHEVRGT